jgi:hypothetical protein
MTSMLKQEKNSKVRVNILFPKELDREWREFIIDKYGVYRRGMLTKVLEDSLKHYMQCNNREKEKEANVRALIYDNLQVSSYWLGKLLERGKSKGNIQYARQMFEVADRLYRDLPIELKATCFKSDVLSSIQLYYDLLTAMAPSLFSAISRYEKEVKENESLAITNLDNEIPGLLVPGLRH